MAERQTIDREDLRMMINEIVAGLGKHLSRQIDPLITHIKQLESRIERLEALDARFIDFSGHPNGDRLQ